MFGCEVSDFGFKIVYDDGREEFQDGFESYHKVVCVASMMMEADDSIELISIATKSNGVWSYAD